jgi:hypothetical protein
MLLPLAHAACLCLALSAGEPRPLKDVVADLGSNDFKAREAATDELADGKMYSLAQLEGALKDPALTAEQKMRIERAGLRTFKDTPHGALGVEFTGAITIAEIGSVKKGFPSALTLKPGDIITQIDGEPVTSRVSQDGRASSVRVLVVSHEPGDEVPVVVLRNGAPVKLTVKFGDFRDLKQDPVGLNGGGGFNAVMPVIDDFELQAAWKQRIKRVTGVTDPAPIDATSLRPRRDNMGGTWGGDGAAIDVIDRANRDRAMMGETPSVTAGATPDHDRQREHADQALNGGFNERFNNNGFGRAFNPALARPAPRDFSRTSDIELTSERLNLIQQRAMYLQAMEQPRLAPEQKQQFRMIENQFKLQINQLDEEIARRKAARQPLPKIDPQPDVQPAVAPDVNPGKP